MPLRPLIIAAFVAPLLASVGAMPARAEAPPAPLKETAAEAQAKSAGCISCHTTTDSLTMHSSPGVILGCADCHGGNPMVFAPPGARQGEPSYRQALDAAHVKPRFPAAWN